MCIVSRYDALPCAHPTPIGLRLFTTSKAVRRAFDERARRGGWLDPVWLVLTNLKAAAWRSQHDLAGAVGIEGPTLTRHLDALERRGSSTRRQDPANRRAVVVELTPEGHAAHARLLDVVIAFDRRLRSGLCRRRRSTRWRELLRAGSTANVGAAEAAPLLRHEPDGGERRQRHRAPRTAARAAAMPRR